MRHAFLVALLLSTWIAVPAQAEDTSPPALPGRVQLVEDDANAMLRVLLDGTEVARCRAAPEKKIDCEVIAADAAILPAVAEPAPLPANSRDGAP